MSNLGFSLRYLQFGRLACHCSTGMVSCLFQLLGLCRFPGMSELLLLCFMVSNTLRLIKLTAKENKILNTKGHFRLNLLCKIVFGCVNDVSVATRAKDQIRVCVCASACVSECACACCCL